MQSVQTDTHDARIPLLYVLHSGNLYGTERMALATARHLLDDMAPTIAAPAGPALAAAERQGLTARAFSGSKTLIPIIRAFLGHRRGEEPRRVFVATGVSHSLLFWALSRLSLAPCVHLHLVHGGTDERLSYGRKRLLNRLGVRFIAVSEFVRERLLAHGVRADRIEVIENFLDQDYAAALPRRDPDRPWALRRICIISRVDPIKRLDLLFDAIDAEPALRRFQFRIFGEGWDFERLRARAHRDYPSVEFVGFQPNAVDCLREADLLLHLCPVEPFGLAILEAMTAGVPVLVPDSGGAGSLVRNGESGFRFRADDAGALARELLRLGQAGPAEFERVVAGAQALLSTRFDAAARAADYRAVIMRAFA
jgi:glycosyltransferase involved in cell wall biosynthesis